jgi:2-polyprenyl-3-methyl-5-hydroxy-6-metoxy-1,4-benzoquinol methylase
LPPAVFGYNLVRNHDELGDAAHDRAYDSVTCMEVLEHCLNYDLEKAIRDLYRLVAPGGTVIIIVPIEIGLRFWESI